MEQTLSENKKTIFEVFLNIVGAVSWGVSSGLITSNLVALFLVRTSFGNNILSNTSKRDPTGASGFAFLILAVLLTFLISFLLGLIVSASTFKNSLIKNWLGLFFMIMLLCFLFLLHTIG